MEEKVGVVTDYLNRIGVAVIRLTDGNLRVGDWVRIRQDERALASG